MAQTQTDEPGLFCGCRFFGFFFLRPSVMVSQCHLPTCRRCPSNPRPRVSQHKRASDKRARERTRDKPKPQGEQALDLDVVWFFFFFSFFFPPLVSLDSESGSICPPAVTVVDRSQYMHASPAANVHGLIRTYMTILALSRMRDDARPVTRRRAIGGGRHEQHQRQRQSNNTNGKRTHF